jgi:hypothetical protein
MTVYSPTGSGSTHIDKLLTQISIAWPNNGLVGESLFPSVPVVKQSDKYYIFGREGWAPDNDIRAPGTIANEVPGLGVSLDTYYAQEHSLQIPIPDEERENTDSPLAPDRDATELVTSKIMLGRELAMFNLVTTTTNYPASYVLALAGGTSWKAANYATTDPIADMRGGVSKIHSGLFVEPNTAVIPYQTFAALQDHPKFLSRIQYVERAIFSPELLASVLGFQRVIVPGVGYNTANPGQAATLTYLWGTTVVLAYVPPRAGLRIPAFAYEFTWHNQVVDRWREIQRKSDLIRVGRAYDLKLVALDSNSKSIAGYLITGTLA